MHLILKSTQACGEWSFRRPKHSRKIENIVRRFSIKYGVKIYSLANVGNHLHFHLQLKNRFAYPAFIRAITGAIAMAVTGGRKGHQIKCRFWDDRPYTRVIVGFRGLLKIWDYIKINKLEGYGIKREEARLLIMKYHSTA